jgi:hypothetical protein
MQRISYKTAIDALRVQSSPYNEYQRKLMSLVKRLEQHAPLPPHLELLLTYTKIELEFVKPILDTNFKKQQIATSLWNKWKTGDGELIMSKDRRHTIRSEFLKSLKQ